MWSTLRTASRSKTVGWGAPEHPTTSSALTHPDIARVGYEKASHPTLLKLRAVRVDERHQRLLEIIGGD